MASKGFEMNFLLQFIFNFDIELYVSILYICLLFLHLSLKFDLDSIKKIKTKVRIVFFQYLLSKAINLQMGFLIYCSDFVSIIKTTQVKDFLKIILIIFAQYFVFEIYWKVRKNYQLYININLNKIKKDKKVFLYLKRRSLGNYLTFL